MGILTHLIVQSLAVFGASFLIPGVRLDGYLSALTVALVLGLINIFVKPFLTLLTLPLTIVTLGLFRFVLNAVVIEIVDYLVAGFSVENFLTALLFSLVLSVIGQMLSSLVAKK